MFLSVKRCFWVTAHACSCTALRQEKSHMDADSIQDPCIILKRYCACVLYHFDTRGKNYVVPHECVYGLNI